MVSLTLVVGVLIGASLGALGGGGSILTVPALVYLLGEPAGPATTASLVIVGVTAVAGAAGHARTGHVRWASGTAFGLAGVATSFVGTVLNGFVAADVLLLAFAALMLVAAGAMVRRSRTGAPDVAAAAPTHAEVALDVPPARVVRQLQPASGGPPVRSASSARVAELAREEDGPELGARRRVRGAAVKVALTGGLVGLLTGFFGVGGGFVIVPVLTLVLGYGMTEAVGTSLLVIAINSASALLARTGQQDFHWSVILPFTAAAVVGTLLGKRVSGRVSNDGLTRAFAVLLVLIAGYVGVSSVLGLT